VSTIKRFVLGTVLIISSMSLLTYVDWRIAVGVFLFGWFLNIDNSTRK